jgi:tetratricopeptide (TPR) repeat protein
MAAKLSEALFGPDGTAGVGSGLLQFLAESAYLWAYRGQYEKAIPIFEALTILAPSDPLGYLGIAEMHLSRGKFREADRAADQAARASRVDRRTMAFAYKLKGKALLQLNKPADAEKALRRAMEMDPSGDEGRAAATLLDLAASLGLFNTTTTTTTTTQKTTT